MVVYSADARDTRRDEPAWRGLFYADDVVRWLSVTDGAIRGEALNLGPRAVHGWSRRGFFGMERNEYERNRAFVRFGGVITSRAIALLMSYGIRIGRIQEAHEYLRDATGLDLPFASRSFWAKSNAFSDSVYSKLDELIVTASRHGKLPFTELMFERIGDPGDMEFGDTDGEFATEWEPVPGVVINPGVQTGAACVKGTRTPTYVLHGGYVAGDDVAGLAYAYRLSMAQVRTAIDWGMRLGVVQR